MLKRVIPAFLLALGLVGARDAACVTIAFQDGTLLPGGAPYSNTLDTEIQQGNPTLALGGNLTIRVDALFNGGDVQGLMMFGNIFGALPDQIPLGSTINSAVLTLSVFDSSNVPIGTISVYQMTTTWSESSTWNSLTGGVNIGSDTVASPDDAHTVTATGLTTFDVQASLQAWSSGATNFGWMFSDSSTDSIQFDSSEAATVTARPLLTVDFTPVPEPGSLVLAGLAGAAALCVRRLRRGFRPE
ncbi:MAG TPA: DNRLRE domain-containing protein [Myxococcota bacterium]|jgi:hypothetical protein